MKVPLSWLREITPTSLSGSEIAELLTRQGVEVEDVAYPWAGLGGVLVARVLEVRDHPNADKLCVTTVDAGAGEREVVAGVRNMTPGDLVPYAPPGATVPGFEGPLRRRELRGVVSDGMLCSPNELGISTDHSGILVLPAELEQGTDLAGQLGLTDGVLEIAVFPNRPDLLSVAGVAREVAAATGEDLRLPDTSVSEGQDKAAELAAVDVLDTGRCPRYLARVITGVRVGPSPLVAQVRLGAAGMRPLSNVVDATNYVLLEMGQPLHPFDLAKLSGNAIVVRRAGKGERLMTLDGVERTLSDEDLLIADRDKGVAIAGVMGSAIAEVGDDTADVLLESAHFDSLGVLRTARRLGLRTEASVRFERGADPEAVAPAAARAARLIGEWSGGTVLAGEIDVGSAPARRTLEVRPARAQALLGTALTSHDVREALGRLRLPAREEGDSVAVEVPGYRVDLEREVDLIEEVARVAGYDALPATLPGVRQAGGLSLDQRRARHLRDVLAAAGLLEASSTSFVSRRDMEIFDDDRREGIAVANPISEEDAVLRSSLVPGLLAAARRNVAQRNPTVRLFEAGRTFAAGGPLEEERVAAVLAGEAAGEWPAERREHGLLDAKGVVEHLLGGLGVENWSLGEPAGAPYHPGRSALVLVDAEVVGEVGEIHPRIAREADLPGRVAAFELRARPLLEAAAGVTTYRDVSRFPPVHRDLAFVVEEGVAAGEVRQALVDEAGPLLDRAALFDVFTGDPVPSRKKSLAFSVDFRASDRTLTDEEVEPLVRTMAERLAALFGAELRSG